MSADMVRYSMGILVAALVAGLTYSWIDTGQALNFIFWVVPALLSLTFSVLAIILFAGGRLLQLSPRVSSWIIAGLFIVAMFAFLAATTPGTPGREWRVGLQIYGSLFVAPLIVGAIIMSISPGRKPASPQKENSSSRRSGAGGDAEGRR